MVMPGNCYVSGLVEARARGGHYFHTKDVTEVVQLPVGTEMAATGNFYALGSMNARAGGASLFPHKGVTEVAQLRWPWRLILCPGVSGGPGQRWVTFSTQEMGLR